MIVKPQGTLAIKHMRSAYPYMRKPALYVSDRFVESPSQHGGLESADVNPTAGGLTAEPIPVPWHQEIGLPYTIPVANENDYLEKVRLPSILWDPITYTGDLTLHCIQKLGSGAQGLEARLTPGAVTPTPDGTQIEAIATQIRVQPDLPPAAYAAKPAEPMLLHGFTAYLRRNLAGWYSEEQSGYSQLGWVVGGLHQYALRAYNNGSLEFLRWESGESGWSVRRLPRSAAGTQHLIGNNMPDSGMGTAIEVTFLNGQLALAINGGASPYLYTVPDGAALASPYITQIAVAAEFMDQFEWEVFGGCWAKDATFTSAALQEPGAGPQAKRYTIVAQSSADLKEDGQPLAVGSGSSIRVSAGAGNGQYVATISNTKKGEYGGREYSHETAVCSRVGTVYLGEWEWFPGAPTYIIPKAIRETTRFDPNSLTVQHSLDVTVDNWHGQWARQCGAVAVQLQLGYSAPAWGLFPRFTGMCDTYTFSRPRGNISTMTMHCTDLMGMFDQPIGAPPDMDGWNHYYAIAYLAQYCGMSRDFLAFRNLVPSNPYAAAGGDPAPYFLPFGTGMNPWTPRNRTLPVIELMNYIRKPTGFLLFIDASGYLRYEKWMPEAAGSPVRTFTESATGADGAGLTEMFDFQFRTSVRQTRNQILLMGIDQFSGSWNPIIAKREDPWSIDAPPGSEPLNYVGFRRPFVWVDPRFANPAFASTSADRLYRMLRIPELAASFRCWMQPDIYVMDVITVSEEKTGANGIPFYVLETVIDYSIAPGGQIKCESQINGRYLV